MMPCKHCTKEIPEGSAFCNFCGKAQESLTTGLARGLSKRIGRTRDFWPSTKRPTTAPMAVGRGPDGESPGAPAGRPRLPSRRQALPVLVFNAVATAAIYLTVREIKRRRELTGHD